MTVRMYERLRVAGDSEGIAVFSGGVPRSTKPFRLFEGDQLRVKHVDPVAVPGEYPLLDVEVSQVLLCEMVGKHESHLDFGRDMKRGFVSGRLIWIDAEVPAEWKSSWTARDLAADAWQRMFKAAITQPPRAIGRRWLDKTRQAVRALVQ